MLLQLKGKGDYSLFSSFSYFIVWILLSLIHLLQNEMAFTIWLSNELKFLISGIDWIQTICLLLISFICLECLFWVQCTTHADHKDRWCDLYTCNKIFSHTFIPFFLFSFASNGIYQVLVDSCSPMITMYIYISYSLQVGSCISYNLCDCAEADTFF